MSKREEAFVTIVCCYNDSGQYEAFCASLEKQEIAYELLGIDNRGQQFSSCSSALNSVLPKIRTEYVIYSHQDIRLPKEDMLSQFVEYVRQVGPDDIVGVAGAAEVENLAAGVVGDRAGTCVLSYILHGKNRSCPGEWEFCQIAPCDTVDECFFGGRTSAFLKEPFDEKLCDSWHLYDRSCPGEWEFCQIAPCDTVDECFFGGRTSAFLKEPFDEKLCDSWHLYAVERCLRARLLGNRVWVCRLPLIHESGGHIDHSYNVGLRRLAAHYDKRGSTGEHRISIIRTVCGTVRTDWLHRNLFYWKRELLFLLHRM